MSGTVGHQGSSYRNGLVLGLTMAEILLLLLFCMLLALGASMQSERQARREVEEKLQVAQRAVRREETLVEALRSDPRLAAATSPEGSSADFDRHWRKLVEASAAVDAMEKAGLPRERILSDPGALVEADKAVRAADGDAAAGSKLRKALAQAGSASDGKAVDEAVRRAVQGSTKDGGHKWPPIISLTEADGFYFASGRAELETDFADKLSRSVIPKVIEIARPYGVDTLEVVGHTDEQPMGGRTSNLDPGLPLVLGGRVDVSSLRPADNAGLGLARAVSVVSRLASDGRLSEFRILPLSGGQLVLNDQSLSDGRQSGDVRQRRRIEIRLRQSNQAEAPKGSGGMLPSWLRLPTL